jgi:hypothetical protein
MKLRGLVPNFHIHVSVNDLYIPIYISRIWERGRVVSFLGKFVSNLQYSVFEVYEQH